jgi:hypothetical protein
LPEYAIVHNKSNDFWRGPYLKLFLPIQARFHSVRPGLTNELTDDLAIVIILWQENVGTIAVTVNPGR